MDIQTVDIGPYKLYTNRADETGVKIFQNGVNYERHVWEELKRLVPLSKGFVDVGCNVGVHAVSVKALDPDMPVICLDVNPENISLLCRTIMENQLSNMTVIPCAAADYAQVIQRNVGFSNTTCAKLGSWLSSEPQTAFAPAIPLDRLSLDGFDLLKLDIEGFEYLALQGGAIYVSENQPRILFEYCPQVVPRSGVDAKTLLNWFLERDYSLTTLDYQPGMRATFTDADALMKHVENTSKWICDILAEPR